MTGHDRHPVDLSASKPVSFTLLTASPIRGWHWLRQGFAAFGRKPLAYSSLLAAFLFVSLMLMSVPLVGLVLLVMAMPLLTLGYMIATRSGEAGGPVHPGQLIEPLRGSGSGAGGGDATRRKRLLSLCALYAVATLLTIVLADALDGGGFERLQVLLATPEPTDATRQEIDALMADGALLNGMLARFTLLGLLSIPFWHAPALVWWGGQGVAQSLFSSTLALWRNKGAFTVYMLGWVGAIVGFGVVAGSLLALLGARGLLAFIAVPAGLLASTAFYVSLYFTFADSFGVATSGRSDDDRDAPDHEADPVDPPLAPTPSRSPSPATPPPPQDPSS